MKAETNADSTTRSKQLTAVWVQPTTANSDPGSANDGLQTAEHRLSQIPDHIYT
jgi:hypothetical protein